MQKKSKRTGALVSKTYLLLTTRSISDFFSWLDRESGYKSKLKFSDIRYFKLQDKDVEIARMPKFNRYPTLEQIEHVVRSMPANTDIQKRNRALIAFMVLSGARAQAIASFRIKHILLEEQRIEQRPDEVKTNNSKPIITYFFPVGNLLEQIFIDWINFLKEERLFSEDAPLCPSTALSFDVNDKFSRILLSTTPWKSTTSLRKVIEEAFQKAGLPYYNPHAFRDTIVQLGYKYCKTPEEFKAWSQNIGHNSPLTNFTSYGSIDEFNQGEIIKRLCKNNDEKPDLVNDLERLIKSYRNEV
jgi:integrase/recombinase XerD